MREPSLPTRQRAANVSYSMLNFGIGSDTVVVGLARASALHLGSICHAERSEFGPVSSERVHKEGLRRRLERGGTKLHLSAPIYRLKRQAKLLARQNGIPLHEALDQMAIEEGFQSWSHLSSSLSRESPAAIVLSRLEPGDLVLLGARPGHGKTLLGLELASKAVTLGRKGYFFTLDYHERDIADRFSALGIDPVPEQKAVVIDTSDEVSANYIINRLERVLEPAVIVIDYLQLLDQRRTNPSLDDQITSLRRYVKATGAICVLISQIDRSFDLSVKTMPDVSDVRLPNPLDLSVFDKYCFLHDGEVQLDQAA